MRIKQIMTTNLITANADDNLKVLSDRFGNNAIHHIPVINDDNELVGIISDRDVSKSLSPFLGTSEEREQDRTSLAIKATDVMTANPITISRESRIDTASILLLENNFSCLPVVNDEGQLEGIVTWKDILNYHVYS